MQKTCGYCNLELSSDDPECSKLYEKGLATLTIRCAQKGLTYKFSVGDYIHKICYKKATDVRSITAEEATATRDTQKRIGFNYRTCCFERYVKLFAY